MEVKWSGFFVSITIVSDKFSGVNSWFLCAPSDEYLLLIDLTDILVSRGCSISKIDGFFKQSTLDNVEADSNRCVKDTG